MFKNKKYQICCINKWSTLERLTFIVIYAKTRRRALKTFHKEYPQYAIIEIVEYGKETKVFYEQK